MSSLSYQGTTVRDVLELHYFDNDGPIFVRLPREGLERMCGCALSDAEVNLVLLSAGEKELFQLIDRALVRCGGFTLAFFENGAQFRKLDITIADIEDSGVTIPTTVLGMAARSGFLDRTTGLLAR
jgi:hypothetical protein